MPDQHNSDPENPVFPWRSLAVPIFLPNLLYSIGQGAIVPMIPMVASRLGCNLAVAGLISAMLVVGALVGDLPSGALIARIGERTAMVGASVVASIGVGIALLANSPGWLGLGVFLIGLATAIFSLARHAFMTTDVPSTYRARAMSTLGGTFRLGLLIGPFLSAWLITATGTPTSAFWVQLVGALAAGILVMTLPDPTRAIHSQSGTDDPQTPDSPRSTQGLWRSIRTNRGVLLTIGLGASSLSALRASRQVLLPLWGVSLGLGEVNIAMIIGIAQVVDSALFYTGGWIMDRLGRIWAILPCAIGLGIGHIALSFTHDLPQAITWYIGMAMFLSLANGIGSGILLTLGSDLADPQDPAPFLGAWRFTTDLGSALAPVLISAITGIASLSIAALALGCLGLAGASVLGIHLPKHKH